MMEGGFEESRSTAHPQELVFQFSCEQLLPSLLSHSLISASPPPSRLLTVSAPVVRLVMASTHPSLQPISHQLCGVLVPTMAEKEKEEEEVEGGEKKQGKGIGEHQIEMLREGLLCVLKNILPHSHIDGLSVVEDGIISLALGSDSCLVARYRLLPSLAGCGGACGRSLLSFTVFMDALAMACYGIPDVRLLWSRDKNFMSQFRCRSASADIHYQPVSLFPPQYAHDISFWAECGADTVAETEGRVGLELSRAAWTVAGSRLARVTHLETYLPPCEGGGETGGGDAVRVGGGVVRVERGEWGGGGVRRVGLCYRVEYSSCDSALARSTASQLQLRLRSSMATIEGLELR